MSGHDHEEPWPVPTSLERALAAEISLRSRMRHVAVGLAGGCGAVLIALLWATEPGPLPARTHAAFAGLVAVGLAWAALAAWVLTRRRPLYGHDRVLGASVAVAATAATAVGAVALAAARGTPAMTLGTALAGTALVTVAVLLLTRARARRRELVRLREALRELTRR
ncbi:transmembrane transport protein [Streptomyces sp. B6B3]|uniref:transmembrane transport protein n=1 Tax=Streptomyces sp. B6B3 TaxID=3153570 RepID=UPI00325DD998